MKIISSSCSLLLGFCAVSAQANTSSPFQPPDEGLGKYVINQGAGLDTGCTFSSGSPLIISLFVPAVVNDERIDPDGKLIDAADLVNKGTIGAQAALRFPVFDIDSNANINGLQPEVDKISWNGKEVKTLSGVNNVWTDDSLIVPIEDVKFGTDNEFRVDIDVANPGDNWCMSVDWVAIEFDVALPYVLAHGINADSSTWDPANSPGVLDTFRDYGLKVDRFSVTSNGRSAGNARQLQTNIQSYLDQLKAEKVHLFAHSKGGLDSQMLKAIAPGFEIASLSTLSTPHLGSVAADLSIIQKRNADNLVNSGADPAGHAATYVGTWTFGQGPQLPGLQDLATATSSSAVAARLRGNINPTFSIGAFADANRDGTLSGAEINPLFPSAAHYAARRAWRVMRDFASASIVSVVNTPCTFCLSGTKSTLTYNTVLAAAPRPNDIVVTTQSANPGYATSLGNTGDNHTSVKNAANAERLILRTIGIR